MTKHETRKASRSFQQLFPPRLSVPALTLVVAAFIIGVDNLAFWQALAAVTRVGDSDGWLLTAATAVFLTSALALLMSLFAFRWLYKPFLIMLLLVAAVVGYFMQTYGVIVDDTMIVNTIDTDAGEVEGLLNFALLGHLLLVWVVPSAFVLWVRIKSTVWWRQALVRVGFGLILTVVALAAVASQYKAFALTLRAHRELRMYVNPTYAIYSAAKVMRGEVAAADHPLVKIGADAQRTPPASARQRRKVMILVVGETARAANWGLNGYRRQTTPELAALKHVFNFPDAHACGTSTAVSVPCMFAAATRDNFDITSADYTENLLDVLKRAGVSVRWLENQAGGCKGVCDRIATDNMRVLDIPGLCGDDHCLDGVFLQGLAERIEATTGDVLLVMHTMGSHGPSYDERYPARYRKYLPVCASNRPQQCSRQSLINSYDNTIRYTDHILAALIDVLKTQVDGADTGLLYVSDHGESLGENGIYLHGFPYLLAPAQQTHIPMIAWLSPQFMQDSGLSADCIERQAQKRVSQDNIFSTVMALLDVTAAEYDAELDLFSACRRATDNSSRIATEQVTAGASG